MTPNPWPGSIGGLRIALIAVAVLVVWNAVFDTFVDAGVERYLMLHELYHQDLVPRPSLDDMMRSAIRDGLAVATAAAAGVMAFAFLVLRRPGRSGRRRS
jgi:hypothetical protein